MFRCSTSRILVFVALFASLFAGQTSTLRAATQQQGGAPDLIISKTTYAPYTLVHGQQTTYMLNWLNFSTASATQVVITDTLPAGMDYASANPLPTSRNGNVITWSVGTLAPFSNNVIYLTVDVTAAAGTVLTNTVTARNCLRTRMELLLLSQAP